MKGEIFIDIILPDWKLITQITLSTFLYLNQYQGPLKMSLKNAERSSVGRHVLGRK